MPQWHLQSVEFAAAGDRTSTEAFYTAVVEQKFNKPFEKINAIDDLIHHRDLHFDDLERLARAELEIGFRKLIPRLDATKPVLIFGDHGFRLAPDGRSFTHGGPFTLERLTLVVLLMR